MDGSGSPPSGWQDPVEEVSKLVLKQLLDDHDLSGVGSLASACWAWRHCTMESEDEWRAGVMGRWGMWEEVKDMRSPCAVMSWLSGACQAGAATWRDIYIHWHGLVDSAVDKALTTTGLKVEEEGNHLRSLLAKPSSLQVEWNAWAGALEVLNKARLGHQDVAFYLLGAESSLVNLLGIHYLMMQPLWTKGRPGNPPAAPFYPESFIPTISTLLNAKGCGKKQVVVRVWTLGVLMMGAGWRTRDQMNNVEGSLEKLVLNEDLWRVLLRGPHLDIRRIVLEDGE